MCWEIGSWQWDRVLKEAQPKERAPRVSGVGKIGSSTVRAEMEFLAPRMNEDSVKALQTFLLERIHERVAVFKRAC